MAHRATPLVVLVWLLLLAMAGAVWMLLSGMPPTEFGPRERYTSERDGGAPESAAGESIWTLTGRVRQRHGRPLEGVRVDVAGHRVETSRDGSFEVPDLPWRAHDVAFWKEGYRLETRTVRPGDAPDVRMRGLTVLRGVVERSDGSPIARHPVRLRGDHDLRLDTQTDATGAFRFERVPSGAVYVTASAHVDGWIAYQHKTLQAHVPRDNDLVVVLPKGNVFRGHVATPVGDDVEGAEVHASYYRHGSTRNGARTLTDAEGRFALVVPPEQECSMIVETPTPEDGWRYLRWYRHKLLPNAGTLEVRLEQGHAIEGRIVGGRGVSLQGRRVRARRVAGNQTTYITEGGVKADGTFRIGGLWEARYQLRVSGAESADDGLVLSPTRSVKTGTDVVLHLHRARRLEGRVLTAAGNWFKSAEVVVRRRDLGFIATTKSGDEGRFEFPRVPPGTLSLAVRRGNVHSEIDRGTCRAGDTNIEIRLPE